MQRETAGARSQPAGSGGVSHLPAIRQRTDSHAVVFGGEAKHPALRVGWIKQCRSKLAGRAISIIPVETHDLQIARIVPDNNRVKHPLGRANPRSNVHLERAAAHITELLDSPGDLEP